MKINCFLIISFFLLANGEGFGQFKRIPTSLIYKQHVRKYLVKQDSLIKIYDNPLIEVHKLAIKINSASYNNNTKELTLIGKICYGDTIHCMGLPNIEIFKGVRDSNNILTSFKLIGKSKENKNIDKAGTFYTTFKLSKKESLMFYLPSFYLEEFKIGKLINSKEFLDIIKER